MRDGELIRRVTALVGALLLLALGVVVLPAHAATASSPLGTWALATAPSTSSGWSVVYYGHGEWIALNHTGGEAASTDGSTWTAHSTPVGSWQSIAYGNGLFVALGSVNSGPHEMTSTNGVNWTTVAGPTGQWTGKWTGLAFGNGRFVAAGSQGQAVVSTDGVHWTTTFSRRFDHLTSIAFGNGRFVAVDNVSGDTIVSTDGVRWAFYTTPMAGLTWGTVAYGNGNFVAFDASGSGYFATTVMGYVWTLHRYSPAQEIDGAIFGCGSFVATGQSTGSTNNFFTSPTGATWSSLSVPSDPTSDWTSVSYGAHRFVAVNSAGAISFAHTSANCAATTPSAPQQVSGNIHDGEVWTYMHPPVSAGGAPVDSYRVTITDGVLTKYCYAPVYYEPNCIIRGLTNRHVYRVTAQSHNRFGFSAPSDTEFAITVPTWGLTTWTPAVVLASSPVLVQLTGIRANSLGFYPVSLVTFHFGSRVFNCWPNVFGECLITVSHPAVAVTSMYATYTGYGTFYRSPTARVAVASVTVSSTDVVTNGTLTVSLHGGVAGSTARATLGAVVVSTILNGAGDGSLQVTAPSTAGPQQLSVADAGVNLERVPVSVHT